MRYGDGPTRRVSPPRTVAGARPADTSPAPTGGTGKGKGKGSSLQPSGSKPDRTVSATPKNWRDVRRSDPEGAREIFVTTKLAGRAHDVGIGVATGAIGGVYGGGYRGGGNLDDDWVCDPWGYDDWSSCDSGWGWGWSWSWSWGWCGSSYPYYWSWYYPCWWWYSRPYYASDYCYYGPATQVVYAEPQVIYIESESEPVGEVVVQSPAGRIAPPDEAPNPLSIAAQRYLELGDRAFREGRYTDAVQFYAKAVEFAPDQGALYLVLSDALFAAGDYHYGAYSVRRALELDPALIDSNVDKHGFYPDPAHFDAQLETLERYLANNPGDRDARLVLALNYLLGGRARDAARTIDSAVSGMSDDPAAQAILQRARKVAHD